MITRKNLIWWLIGLTIALIVAPLLGKVLIVVVGIVVYLISLQLHPHADCRGCGGSGMHRGLVFGWSQRRCGTCGGTPRHRRWGNMVLHPGQLTRAERRAGVAQQRRNRPLP